jgi:2-polyprenyl-6-methoxyphenol hydroxylase-like FAD-dependent oxidoreductase
VTVDLFTRARVSGYAQRDTGVDVQVATGEVFPARALIGADGLRSAVRAALLADGDPRVSGDVTYRAVLPLAAMPEALRWNDMTIWCGPGTHVVHYPLRGGELFNLVVTCHAGATAEAHNEPAAPAEVLPRFMALCDLPRQLLAVPEEFRRWVLCDRAPVPRWSEGAVTLLGDAAHPMLQYFAQGACMALEDAVCLAEAAHAEREDLPAGLIRYELARIDRTAKLQLGSRLMGRLYHAAGAERRVRAKILGGLSQDEFRERLAWLYAYDARGLG